MWRVRERKEVHGVHWAQAFLDWWGNYLQQLLHVNDLSFGVLSDTEYSFGFRFRRGVMGLGSGGGLLHLLLDLAVEEREITSESRWVHKD